MVPDLALGIFATATSTGDLWGDGDAVGFPVASLIIPLVDQLLVAQDLESLPKPNATFLASISGTYCTANRSSPLARTLGLERVAKSTMIRSATGTLDNRPTRMHMQPATIEVMVMRRHGSPPMMLRYEGGDRFRQTMGPEDYMPASLPPCHSHDESAPAGQNLCPLSCGRRLFRGSGELLQFAVDERPGEYHGMMGVSGAFVCHRYHPANASTSALSNN
eukprot:COSAG02_NODE_3706_length_6353_cov_4.591142_5_plen_220_part_00